MSDYQVYGLVRPDTRELFYIGAARGRLPWRHVRERFRSDGNRAKNAIICHIIDVLGFSDIPVMIFREGLTQQEAGRLETALIYAIGRQPHGPLVNVLPGGELVEAETRTLMSESAKERDRSGAWEERRKARMGDPDVREKMAAAKLGKPSAKRGRKFPSANAKAAQQRLGWITNGIEQTRIDKDVPIPDGWRRGRLPLSETAKANMRGPRAPQSEEVRRAQSIRQRGGAAWLHTPEVKARAAQARKKPPA